MLRHADATEGTDRRLSEAVARWTGLAVRVLPYSRDPAAADALVNLMERFGRRGQMAEAAVNNREAFLYICARPDGETFAQGLGETPGLAICDAFLNCRENDDADAPRPVQAASRPPAPLFSEVGFEPAPEPEVAYLQCVNCGWEGPEPSPDPRRCPGCRRNFLRPRPRRAR